MTVGVGWDCLARFAGSESESGLGVCGGLMMVDESEGEDEAGGEVDFGCG